MTALFLSIAILATGTIVPDVEAKKPSGEDKKPGGGDTKPPKDDSVNEIHFSCTDRKGAILCKASSNEKIGAFSMKFPDGGDVYYTGTCQRTQSFGDSSIEPGIYEVRVHECGTNLTYDFEITVDANLKITSIVGGA